MRYLLKLPVPLPVATARLCARIRRKLKRLRRVALAGKERPGSKTATRTHKPCYPYRRKTSSNRDIPIKRSLTHLILRAVFDMQNRGF